MADWSALGQLVQVSKNALQADLRHRETMAHVRHLVKELAAARATVRKLEKELAAEKAKGLVEIVVTVEEEEEEASVEKAPPPPRAKAARADIYYCPHCAAEYKQMRWLRRHLSVSHSPVIAPPPVVVVENPTEEHRQQPDPGMPPEDLINKRVAIWWGKEGQWFNGTVTSMDEVGRHVVHYDDGEVLSESLLSKSKYPRRGWMLLVSY